MATPPDIRFWRLVDRRGADECWLWTGAVHRGYGQFTLLWWKKEDGKYQCQTVRAHRFAYESMVGPIPDGLTIDHRCRVRSCVNPAHLRPMEASENSRQGNLREMCRSGRHSLEDEANVIRRPSRPSERECRECFNEGQRRRQRAKKAAAK